MNHVCISGVDVGVELEDIRFGISEEQRAMAEVLLSVSKATSTSAGGTQS